MSYEWLPGVLSGAAITIVGAIANRSYTNGQIDQKTKDLQKQFDEADAEMRETVKDMHDLITAHAVATTETTVFMRTCTKTLEGIANKLEVHDHQIMQQDKDIALLKLKTGGLS